MTNETMKDEDRSALTAATDGMLPNGSWRQPMLEAWQARAASPQSGEEGDERQISWNGFSVGGNRESVYEVARLIRAAGRLAELEARVAAPQAALSILADVLFALTERQKGNIIRSEDAYVAAAHALLNQGG